MVLGLPNADVAAALGAVEADEWRTAKPLEGDLVVATRLWVDDGVPLGPSFVDLALRYGASAERVPIARDASKARDAMNAWVSQRTAGKILELLGQGALDAHPRMVVTNAAYLKARWAEPFPKAATKDEEFFVSGKTRVMAPTMHVDADLRYAAVDAAKLVELRYDGTPLTMLLVVPEDRAGLSRLEERLSVDALDRWTKALTPRRVTLGMPRFTFATGGALNDGLRELGLRSAFGDRADFGGMTAGNASRATDAPEAGRLAIGQIVQRTYIAVDEIGTEAAAATGVVMRTTSVDLSSPVPVLADRPFLFLVRDASRGRVLFVGRVDDPR
jgi:serpin B